MSKLFVNAIMLAAVSASLAVVNIGCGNSSGQLETAFDNATEEQLEAARERDKGEEIEEEIELEEEE